jgi:4-amino-4-deoxy-L-arabinose transferase-like glycosyltransferase
MQQVPRIAWAAALILVFYFLALDSVVGDSPTMDEQNHLARGLAFLKTGDPRLSVEHPPLINVLSALPLLTIDGLRLPLNHPSWGQPEGWYAFAEELVWVANHDVTRMVFLARLPIVFLTLGLALTVYHLARHLWGSTAGLLSLALVLLDPNILAHGRYTTTDLGGALFITLAALLVWRMWSGEENWRRVAAAGLGLGLALGSKHSNLVFLPLFGLMALMPLYGGRPSTRAAGRRLRQLFVAGLVALPVLWALYAFDWGTIVTDAALPAFLRGASLPMPEYWAGVSQILSLSAGGRPAFLLGQFSTTGWPTYFPIAWAVKTPLVSLLLFGVAAVALVRRPDTRLRALFLLVPAAGYFLVSIQSGLNIGYRHLLPILPPLYVMGAGLVTLRREPRGEKTSGGRFALTAAALPTAAACLLLAADIWIHPHYLSFFNPLAGGPRNGYNVLIDSNIDWGQDLVRLREWMAAHDVPQIKLAWFGTADPAYYGIQYEALPGLPRHFDLWWNVPFDPEAPSPGVYAISVTNLWELPLEEKYVFSWFRAREPTDRIGYSILIYEIPAE